MSLTAILLSIASVVILILLFGDFKFTAWLRNLVMPHDNLVDNRSRSNNLEFYRRYRINDYNGPGKDLLIPHSKVMIHDDFWTVEDQFLTIPFGETGNVILFGNVYKVMVMSQTTGFESDAAIKRRQQYLRDLKDAETEQAV